MPAKQERATKKPNKGVPSVVSKRHKVVKTKAATAPSQVVQARMSPKITSEASMVLEAIGLTVSEAFRLFLVKVAHDRQLPFEPLRVPNKETIRAMEESRQAKGKRYKTIESLFEGLDAE
jgi:DNA-damage-inducible protein J